LSPYEQPQEPETAEAKRMVMRILSSEAEVLEVKLILVDPGRMLIAESKANPTFGDDIVRLPQGVLSGKGPRISERFFEELEGDYVFATAPTRIEGEAEGHLIAIKPVQEMGSATSSLMK